MSLTTPLAAARDYVLRGFAPIPIPKRAKAPVLDGWEKLRLAENDLAKHFKPMTNIGLLLGDPSGGLVDVDLDAPEAVVAADLLLPPTGMIHGRSGKPHSHWWYRVPTPAPRTTKFHDVAVGRGNRSATLVEMRSTGAQTIVPPSVHTSGEAIEWVDLTGPSMVDGRVLAQHCATVAAAALIARHWPGPGARHDTAMALAGVLLRAGMPLDDAERFITAVARAAGDDEDTDRIATVEYTARKLASNEPATGLPTLTNLIGHDVTKRITTWLNVDNALLNGITPGPQTTAQPRSTGSPMSSAPQRFHLLTAAQVKKRPPPSWLVDEILVAGSLAAISAPPATFKTFVGLGLSLATATATPWFGRSTRLGTTVYVSAEGSAGMGLRIGAWELHHGTEVPETGQFLLDAPQLMDSDHINDLQDTLTNLPIAPVLIVIDTLARCFLGGDENSSRDMGLFVAGAERLRRTTGACVLLIHHVGKATGKLRGSSALEGALDTIIELKRDDDQLTIACAKQKDAAEFAPIHLTKRVVGLADGSSSLVLHQADPGISVLDRLTEHQRQLAQRLCEVYGTRGATRREWLSLATEMGISVPTFNRASKHLTDLGLIIRGQAGQTPGITTVSPSDALRRAFPVQNPGLVSRYQAGINGRDTGGHISVSRYHPLLRGDTVIPRDWPPWGCPDCGERHWDPRAERQWACRACGAIWSDRRAIGDLIYPCDEDGNRCGAVCRITDIAEHAGERWCALDGTTTRYSERRCEPASPGQSSAETTGT